MCKAFYSSTGKGCYNAQGRHSAMRKISQKTKNKNGNENEVNAYKRDYTRR